MSGLPTAAAGEAESGAAAVSKSNPPARRLLNSAVVAGWTLLVAYFVVRQLIPGTPRSEFVYDPFDARFHVFAPLRGFTAEQLAGHVLRFFVLGPGLLLLTIGLARGVEIPRWMPGTVRRFPLWAGAFSLSVTSYILLFVLRGRALCDDESVYAGMARAFSRGLIAEPAYSGMVLRAFEVVTNLGVTGKYLFGEPLVQLLGVMLGMPPLLHILLNAVTLIALYHSVRLFSDDRTLSACSCVLLALSPTFMFCAATGLSQSTSLSCITLGVLGYAVASRRGRAVGGLLSGSAVAMGMTVRPQAMLPVAFVFGCAFILLSWRTRRFQALGAFSLAAASGVATIALYDIALTGNPLELPWFLEPRAEHYGFGPIRTESNIVHSPVGAMQNLFVVAIRTGAWWLGLPLASLLILRRNVFRQVFATAPIFLFVSLAIVVFEFGYYSTGVSDVGPIYHFEILLGLAVLSAQFVMELARKRPELAVTGLLVHLVIGTGSFVLEEGQRLGRLVEAIHREPDAVVAALPKPALLLFETRCAETRQIGWVRQPFAWQRDPRDPLVIFPRPRPSKLGSFLARFPGRHCFYVHRPRFSGSMELLECSAASSLLMRPTGKGDDGPCPYLPSTAQLLGWYTPPLD